MKFVIDENMPLADALFAGLGEVVRLPGRGMSAEQVADADVLLVRSVTRVNRMLLANNSRLQFVGTATIGTDHVDQELLAERGIRFASAPGCNKVAVGEYVISALLVLAERYQLDLTSLSIGIVGAGNTGTSVATKAQALGIQVRLCDPPKQAAGDPRAFVSLDEALECDLVSFHVPLTRSGPHATHHMLDAARIAARPGGQILINACRGEVWDNQALLARQQGTAPLRLVMDVWEHEPAILRELVSYTELATPHIAGYSLEGRLMGSYMLYLAYCAHAGLPASLAWQDMLPEPALSAVWLGRNPDAATMKQLIHLVYDVRCDDARFRQRFTDAASFDLLRKQYPERRECSSLHIRNGLSYPQLAHLGFTLNTQGDLT